MSADTQTESGPKIIALLKSFQNEKDIPCVSSDSLMCNKCGISCVRHPDSQTREITLYPKKTLPSTRYVCLVEKAGPDEKVEALDKELELFSEELAKITLPVKIPELMEPFLSRLEKFELAQKEKT